MYEIMEKENMVIEDMIYNIRGVQVMLDKDVAKLYQVETRKINQVIKRNIDRFPKEFCFKLTKEETEELSLRSQIATLNKNNNSRGNNIKYLPYVLTEQGIMMLSGLLKNDIAAKVNVQIIDAFVKMRKYISGNLYLNEKSYYIYQYLSKHHKFNYNDMVEISIFISLTTIVFTIYAGRKKLVDNKK